MGPLAAARTAVRAGLLISLLYGTLFALEITLKRGIEKHRPYAVLHLRDADPFTCLTFYDERSRPTLYQCRFAKRPLNKLEATSSDFFDLRFGKEAGYFVVEIEPKLKSFITPLPPIIYEKSVVEAAPSVKSGHWNIVGYEQTPPYLGQRIVPDEKLSFPIDFKRYATPSIGAVDINGEPVFVQDHRQIERFIAVKEAFDAGRYQKAYELATAALQAFPDSVFASDFLRYRIKSLVAEDMKEHADEIIKLGKQFIRRYASDEYLPEVLLLLARVYSATGFVSDADYFFNRLIHEHKGSRFANLGLIYLGDQLYMNGKVKEAMRSYTEALYEAKHLDVASLAAYKLAVRYLERGETDKALEYLQKLWRKNPSFLLKDKEDAHRIALQLAARNRYAMAIAINEALLKRLKKLDPLYEEILYEIGSWYDAAKRPAEAIKWYERYLKEFAYGDYSDKVKEALDALFVTSDDVNAGEALKRYDRLIEEYGDSPIAQKALVAKMRVLLAKGAYEKVLALADALSSIGDSELKAKGEALAKEAARRLVAKAYEQKACQEVLTLLKRFKMEPPSGYAPFLFGCDMRYALYEDALKIAKDRLKSPNIQERRIWLCRALRALTALKRYREALKAAEDLKALEGKKGCKNYDWDYGAALMEAGGYAAAMAWLRTMSERYPDDIRMADLYRRAYDLARRAVDLQNGLWILKRLVALQNRLKSHPYSPWAEFELIAKLKEAKRYDEALKVAERGAALPSLKGGDRARLAYETATLYELLGRPEQARRALMRCAKTQNGGDWAKLCRQSLALQ